MSTVLAPDKIPLQKTDQHAFNEAVWETLHQNPDLIPLSYQVQTDKYGQLVMTPPPAPSHGSKQVQIAILLAQLQPKGKTITECPVSTSNGVRSADVAWCSEELWQKYRERTIFIEAPELCVEVVSPSNPPAEMEEKVRLYFESGAQEVWLCELDGTICFYRTADEIVEASALFPSFTNKIDL